MRLVHSFTFFFALFLIFLPVYSLAQRASSTYFDVLVSTKTLERGHAIVAGDVELRSTTKNDPRAVRNIDSVLGMVLKRTLGKNTTIKRDYLLNASTMSREVDRGVDVVIIAEREGLRVTANGKLRESAKVGDTVKIENLSSGKIITGRLIDATTVLVNF